MQPYDCRSLVQFFLRPRVGQLADEQEETTLNPTALEKALRSFAARKNGLVVQPTVGTHFDSMAEALEFYNLYSWQIGFGTQYDRSHRNNEKTKTIQDIVCVCAVSSCTLMKLYLLIQLCQFSDAVMKSASWLNTVLVMLTTIEYV